MTILGPGPVGGEPPEDKKEAVPFAIIGNKTFAPQLFPDVVRVRRARDLDRNSDLCKGETVVDKGAENREIHVAGKILGPEKGDFDELGNASTPHDVVSITWSGEVMVDELQYEGPTGWHPPSGYYFYDYTLDLVSTGERSEPLKSLDGQTLPAVETLPEEIITGLRE